MTELERLQRAHEAREQMTTDATDCARKAHEDVIAKNAAFDGLPDGADDTKAIARIKKAEATESTMQLRLKRCKKLEAEALAALKIERRTRNLEKLEAKQFILRDRVKKYWPLLEDLIRQRRLLKQTVTELERLNSDNILRWEESNELAVEEAVIGHEHRCPRPRDNESLLLARVLIGKTFGVNETDTTPRYLTGFEKPRWDDAALNTYEAITKLLESAKPAESVEQDEDEMETGT